MKEIRNEELGNFGFLLDYGQDFLFELAQLAESNAYVNKRLCAVYIRQLTEGFFDTIIADEGIEVNKSLCDGVDSMASIGDKQKAIERYYNDKEFRRPEYGKKMFPRYPGADYVKFSRIECPEGEGDNRIRGELVDSSMKTLYIWDFIRRLGNAGSHAVLSEDNKRWLEEKYIKGALKQLCFSMQTYYHGISNRVERVKTSENMYSLSSHEVFYPVEGSKEVVIKRQGTLPGYTEQLFYTVMPKLNDVGGKKSWANYINKYSIVRRYEMFEQSDVREYFLQSQKAYLVLQQNGALRGIAPYAVLADLRNNADYYVTSYQFEVEPYELSEYNLNHLGLNSEKCLVNFVKQFVDTMFTLSENHIYHRSLTHNSIKLCRYDNGRTEAKLIDFELVKLYEIGEESFQATVYGQANELSKIINERKERSNRYEPYGNIRQYGTIEWTEDTSEEQYRKEQKRRTGMIIRNLLCPVHFDNTQVYEKYADREEVENTCNTLYKDIQKGKIEKLYGISERLINEEGYSLEKALGELEELDDGKYKSYM